MTSRSSKRSCPSPVDGSPSARSGDEKTIPFLRRLTDMLIENEEYISFTPGSRAHGKVELGKIVVHDRVKVENSILPRYFNHSSFASLRRQLNYFSFTRVGKGRQRGATYCNEGVVELEDILTLTRRSVSSSTGSGDATLAAASKQAISAKVQNGSSRRPSLKETKDVVPPNKCLRTIPSSNSVAHTPCTSNNSDNVLPARVSPVEGLIGDKPAPKRISLDLTGATFSPESTRSVASVSIVPSVDSINGHTPLHSSSVALVPGDEDDQTLLDGCRALLCFSRGIIPSR